MKFEVSTGSGLMANHFTLPLDGDIMRPNMIMRMSMVWCLSLI